MKINILLSLVCCLVVVSCSISNRALVAQNTNFWLVEAGSDDSFALIAKDYLGDPALASMLIRYNPGIQAKAGEVIAVPKDNLNPSAVYASGIQVVPILCYHQFTSKKRSLNSMMVTRNDFARQMAYLKDNGYQVIPLSDVGPFLQGKKPLPDKSVVITVDDGYASFYQIAYPILKQYGYPSTLFVYTDFVGIGRALSWQQIEELNNDPLIAIQSHSKSHANLAKATGSENDNDYLARLAEEVDKPDKILRKKTQHPIEYFAYPYGNSSPELIKILQQRDYRMALTVRRGSNPSYSSPYLLRRTMIYGQDNLKSFSNKLDVFHQLNLQ